MLSCNKSIQDVICRVRGHINAACKSRFEKNYYLEENKSSNSSNSSNDIVLTEGNSKRDYVDENFVEMLHLSFLKYVK